MPITYEFCDDEFDFHARVEGCIDRDDAFQYVRSMLAERNSFCGVAALVEMTNVSLRGFDIITIGRLAREIENAKSKLSGSATAVVVDSPIAYTVSRLFRMSLLTRHEFNVFRDRNEAIEWLGRFRNS
jgi:hypothetical protein